MFPSVGKRLHKQQELTATRRRSPCVPPAWGLISQRRGEKAGAPQPPTPMPPLPPNCHPAHSDGEASLLDKRRGLMCRNTGSIANQSFRELVYGGEREWWRWLGGAGAEKTILCSLVLATALLSRSASVVFCSAAPIGSSFWDVIDHTRRRRARRHCVVTYCITQRRFVRLCRARWQKQYSVWFNSTALSTPVCINQCRRRRHCCNLCCRGETPCVRMMPVCVSAACTTWIHAQWYLHKWAPQR